jgi:tripartite-type tricarboxylate transporter receptor subunit TctC
MQHPVSRRSAIAALSSAILPVLVHTAYAQNTWPSKPIRLLVPFAPGGSSEIVARSTANELTKILGQTVFVENKPGASGNIAMQECAASTDGHTMVLGHVGTLAVNPFIFDKLPFDINKDFKPIPQKTLKNLSRWPSPNPASSTTARQAMAAPGTWHLSI